MNSWGTSVRNSPLRHLFSIALALALSGCASVGMLPPSAAEAGFDSGVEGKTGWSKYQESARFERIDRTAAFNAAKVGLGSANFSLVSANLDKGFVMGEHGMTLHDWNVIAGVYFREREGGVDVKVIVEGSKDFGFSGDATGGGWTGMILNGMRSALGSTKAGARTSPGGSPEGAGAAQSSGTGFLVSSDGLIVTAQHVIDGAKTIRVLLKDGRDLPAKVVSSSKTTDIAILQVEVAGATYLPIQSASSLALGDSVYTLGFPAVDILGAEHKYSDGKVSALSGLEGDNAFLQVTVPVQPGNSGGPLIDSHGRVVGVITSTAAVEAFYRHTGALPQGITWAVKSDFIATMTKLPPMSSGEPDRKIADAVPAVCQIRAAP